MDKNSAKNLIKKTLRNPFDKKQFIYFIKNLLNKIDESKTFHARGYVPEIFKGFIKTYERIATYTDPEDNKIDILIVYLQKETTLGRARTAQRNFVARYLKGRDEKNAGLIAFVSPNRDDWRFSFVKMEYDLVETPSGNIKAKEEFTPARRFSFLVGKNESSHTAQSCLVPRLQDDIYNPTLRQLEEVFSIEKVTKEFFERYRDLFLWTKEVLDEIVTNDPKIKNDFTQKRVNTADFAKKLLGQIVFLYFLQKKGWFGVAENKNWGEGDKKFLRNLFEKCRQKGRSFFNDYLEFLFYDALNKENRGGIDPSYYPKFNCKIPFLNGGLFDPINNYDWVHTDIFLPNKLFSNTYKTKEGDIGTGILDIFDRYNFTIKEDEPLEKEVAVDPVMLGKVFENLLEVKDRKSKGTYYTPREIVHYMCQQSLINYLATECEGKVSKEGIEALIRYGELAVEHDSRVEKKGRETDTYFYKLPESIRSNAKFLDEKLANIRVCDPAIGSGAFPVGMMSEIIRARNVLTTYIENKERYTMYDFKRHAIQNCLYGVDIDPGAVEIAKLRLWLSLVVDEEDIKQIKPLPNLDYKIVCGNSLLGVEKNLFNQKLFVELEKLKPLYFNETNARRKQEYKNQIDALIKQITNGHKDFDFEVYFSEVFHEKGGFDVVVANPPYVSMKKFPKDTNSRIYKEFLLENYETFTSKSDLYCCFFEKSLGSDFTRAILRREGIITFICSATFFCEPSFQELRNLILSKEILFITIPRGGLFENVLVNTALISIKNRNFSRNNQININQYNNVLKKFESRSFIPQKRLSDLGIFLVNAIKRNIDILRKVGLLGSDNDDFDLVGDIFDFANGISTAENELWLCDTTKNSINDWIKKNNEIFKNKKNIKKYYKGDSIERYFIKDTKIVINYLRDKIIERNRRTHSAKDDSYFNRGKILSRLIDSRINLALDDQNRYVDVNINMLYLKDSSRYAVKYLLAILNSKLIGDYVFNQLRSNLSITHSALSIIPMKRITSTRQNPFVEIVNKILTITKDDDYLRNKVKQKKIKEYEHQIDKMVYNLCGLTEKEVEMVENFNKKQA